MAKKKEQVTENTTGDDTIVAIVFGAIIVSLALSGFALYRTYQTNMKYENGYIKVHDRNGWEPLNLYENALYYSNGQIKETDSIGYDRCMNSQIRKSLGIADLEKKLSCLETGGHEYGFVEKCYVDDLEVFLFKCSKCGNPKSKPKTKLTDSEIQALKELNIIKQGDFDDTEILPVPTLQN